MSLFSKVNVCLILIAMVFALAPVATYAAAYIKFDGISAKKMPRMRVTDKTKVHEVAVFAARHAGVDVDRISVSWRGKELNGRRTLGSYSVPSKMTISGSIPAGVSGDLSGVPGRIGQADPAKRKQVPVFESLNFEEIKVTLKD